MKALLFVAIIYILQTIALSENVEHKKLNPLIKSYPKKVSKRPIVINNSQKYNLKFKLKKSHEQYTVFPRIQENKQGPNVLNSTFFVPEHPEKSKPSVKRVLPDYAKRIKRSAIDDVKIEAPNETKKDRKKIFKKPENTKKIEAKSKAKTRPTKSDSKNKTDSNTQVEISNDKKVPAKSDTKNITNPEKEIVKSKSDAKSAKSEIKHLTKTKTENDRLVKETPNSNKKQSRRSRNSAHSRSRSKQLRKRRDSIRTNDKNHKVVKHSGHSNKRSANSKKELPVASRRLIGAKEAVIEDFPYVVSIQKDHEHWCSGALLNPRLVITTANCVWKSKNRSRLKVRAGSKYAHHGGQVAKVQQVLKNPLWNIRASAPDNDLALLLLDRKIRFSDSVHEVDLPNRAMMPSFEDAWILSWGTERRDGIYERPDTTLQVYHARLMDRGKCRNITERFGVTVTPNFICLSQNGRKSPCTRDTGAPAVSDGILYGLASWSVRKLCGLERYPSMFSYVASNSNMDFIINATKILMSDERVYPFPEGLPRSRV